jgi:guanylate kinase
VISIFVLPPSKEELHARLVSRGKDDESIISARMEKAKSEMSHYDEFDYVIVNDNFTHALEELVTVVKSASLSTDKQQIRHQSLIQSLVG